MILQISGKMGAGKTTLANSLVKFWQGAKGRMAYQLNYADPLYEMHNFCLGTLKQWEVIPNDVKKDRTLLQILGTEWARNTVDQNVWVKIMAAKINNLKNRDSKHGYKQLFIIGDCRFPNEIDFFKGPDALSIRLDCASIVRKSRSPQWSDTPHESESALDNYYGYDFRFNTESMSVDHCTQIIMQHVYPATGGELPGVTKNASIS